MHKHNSKSSAQLRNIYYKTPKDQKSVKQKVQTDIAKIADFFSRPA
jgi:hypothetical protein